MILSTENTVQGTSVNVTCAEGYEFETGLHEALTSTCSIHGEWQPHIPNLPTYVQ